MKKVIVSIIILMPLVGWSQETSDKPSYNAFRSFKCESCPYKFFVSTNAGVLNTPVGYRVGYLGKSGGYLGTRFGYGNVYHPLTDTKSQEFLFSITTGLIKPIVIQNKFSTHVYFGGGYGQWYNNRWDRWSKNGVEVEAGFMISYKRIMLSFGAAGLKGVKVYWKGDATVGLGVRF